MKVKQLIHELSKIPKDLPIRAINKLSLDDEENQWLVSIEYSEPNESGYESGGEVRLLTSI